MRGSLRKNDAMWIPQLQSEPSRIEFHQSLNLQKLALILRVSNSLISFSLLLVTRSFYYYSEAGGHHCFLRDPFV
jgi:hypothetical protein